MNNYKFRGKRKDNGEWVYGSLSIEYDGACFISYWVSECTDASVNLWEPVQKWHEVIPDTVGMWTGLKDKNGKEIYEGDILRGFQKEQSDIKGKYGFDITDTVDGRTGGFKVYGMCMQDGYVRANNELWQFMWCDRGHHATSDRYYQIDDIEIIGNIHEVKPAVQDSVTHTMNTDPNLKAASEQEAAGQADVTTEQATDEQKEALESASQDAAVGADSEEGSVEG